MGSLNTLAVFNVFVQRNCEAALMEPGYAHAGGSLLLLLYHTGRQ